MLRNRLVLLVTEGNSLPVLALVLAEVQYLKWLTVFDTEQPLAGNVNTPAAKIAADPTAAEFFGDRESSAGAAEEVGHEIASARRRCQNAAEYRFGFLSRKPAVFCTVCGLKHRDSPYIINGFLVSLAILHLSVGTPFINDSALFFIPFSNKLSYGSFRSFLNLWLKLV